MITAADTLNASILAIDGVRCRSGRYELQESLPG